MRFFQPVLWRRAALGLLLMAATALAGEGAQQQARTMVHLLDYIGQDYSAAVRDGEIIDASEYAEMQEFCRSLTGLAQNFLSPAIETEIQNQLAALQRLVENRDTQRSVAARARAIKTTVIAHSHLTVAPTRLPDRARGKLLYQQNCATCHGADGRGDGPSAATLDPKPTSFFDAERMASLSPFQAFNTIRLGVTGTAMAAFDQLPEEAGWDLAFYVVGLRHDEAWPPPGTKPARNVAGLTLEKLASHSDHDLRPLLPGKAEDQPRLLSALRVGYSRPTGNDLGTAATALQASLAAYQQGRFEVARTEALRGYLEGVEPVEAQLLSTKPRLARELEDAMARVRQAIDRREPVGQLEMAVAEAQEKIGRAAGMLEAGSLSPWIVFSMTVAILAREGFEAILVILAILGVTRATSARTASRWVHGGWIAALLLGAVAWLFSDWLLRWSAFQREVMEGISSLLAVTVLLSVGFLLHSKTEIGRWKRFIDVQVKGFLEGRNLLGLAFVAFIGVFREAIETVLFLSALGIQGGPAAKPIILSGVAVALAGVFILGAALLRFSARIPIRTLFSISSCLMALLAVVLTGKGLHSLQESGFLSMTAAPITFRLDLIGLYPTMETLFFQGLILLVVIALWIYARRPSPRLA